MGLGSMGTKLLANKYIELNIQSIEEVTNTFRDERIIEENNYIFFYCRNGVIKIRVDDKDYELSEGMMAYVAYHKRFQVFDGTFNAICLIFGGASVDELIDNSPFDRQIIYQGDDNNHIDYYFYKLMYCFNEANALTLKCLGILYELFYELTKSENPDFIDVASKERHVDIARQYINQNYHNPITIVDVARNVGVTSNYLANIFQLYLHTTPKKYLTKVRMEQAKKLLITKKFKIKEVGNLVGYKNQLHFSGEFKKYTGLSPLDYQRQYCPEQDIITISDLESA